MPADPNPFLAAMAVVSALLVAVLASALAVVPLHERAARAALSARLDERLRERAQLEAERQELSTHLNEQRVAVVLAERIRDVIRLVAGKQALPPAEAQARFGAALLPAAAFTRVWDRLGHAVAREMEALSQDFERYGEPGEGDGAAFERWAAEHAIDFSGRDRWLARHIWRELRLEEERRANESNFWRAALKPIADEEPPDWRWQERHERAAERLEADLTVTERRLRVLGAQIESLESHLRAKPLLEAGQARRGLLALGVLLATGVLLPLLLMPQTAESFTGWHKALVLLGFLAGTAAVAAWLLHLCRPSAGAPHLAPEAPPRGGTSRGSLPVARDP